jgi:hypothetical protein
MHPVERNCAALNHWHIACYLMMSLAGRIGCHAVCHKNNDGGTVGLQGDATGIATGAVSCMQQTIRARFRSWVKIVTHGSRRIGVNDGRYLVSMEDTMPGWYPHHAPTREDLRIQGQWARRLSLVYGAVLLLLAAFLAASRMIAGPNAAPGVAGAAPPHVAERAPAAAQRRRN